MSESTAISYPYLKYDGKDLSVNIVKLNFSDRQSCINAINEIEASIPENGQIEWITKKSGAIPTEWDGNTEFIDMFLDVLNDPSRPQNRIASQMGFTVYGSAATTSLIESGYRGGFNGAQQ